jgi:N-acetylglucosaminyldiphosphoundecaprenol N-acetyl-beta-D-mannosaminyltransferase
MIEASEKRLSELMAKHTIEEYKVFGIRICDCFLEDAKNLLDEIIDAGIRPCTVFFVNTSSLNIVFSEPGFREVINRADIVFGDGTGVRWAARALLKRRLKENVNGTDLTPELLGKPSKRKLSYYLLGAEPDVIEIVAKNVPALFPGCNLTGYHHGFFKHDESEDIIKQINNSGADVLLVGMGSPIQEKWISENKHKITVPVTIAVGGLFSYWSNQLDRAPLWLRNIGMEWVHVLIRQPWKWKRYIIGNVVFLARIMMASIKNRKADDRVG